MKPISFGPNLGPAWPFTLALPLLVYCTLAGDAAWHPVEDGVDNPPEEAELAILLAGERWMEAECAEGGEEWEPDSTESASNRYFVYFPGNDKYARPKSFGGPSQLTFTVDLSVEADYTLYFRVNSPEQDRNSVWVSVDDGPWAKFWRQRDQEQLMTDGFEWREVVDDGSPLDLHLEAGKHTIRVAARETGTELDKIFLSPSGRHPDGTGGDAPTCPRRSSSTLTSSRDLPGRPLALHVYPNPAADVLRVRLPSVSRTPTLARIIGADGRRYAATFLAAPESEDWLFYITQLRSGVYTLHVSGERNQPDMVASFIKVD
ncbi:MAG: T9SS type A sorting domain-containing protein [Lewinella sp.]